jgi:hypothetical protein
MWKTYICHDLEIEEFTLVFSHIFFNKNFKKEYLFKMFIKKNWTIVLVFKEEIFSLNYFQYHRNLSAKFINYSKKRNCTFEHIIFQESVSKKNFTILIFWSMTHLIKTLFSIWYFNRFSCIYINSKLYAF